MFIRQSVTVNAKHLNLFTFDLFESFRWEMKVAVDKMKPDKHILNQMSIVHKNVRFNITKCSWDSTSIKLKKKESYLKYLRYLIGNAICCSFEIAQMTYVRFYTGKFISFKIKKKKWGEKSKTYVKTRSKDDLNKIV